MTIEYETLSVIARLELDRIALKYHLNKQGLMNLIAVMYKESSDCVLMREEDMYELAVVSER